MAAAVTSGPAGTGPGLLADSLARRAGQCVDRVFHASYPGTPEAVRAARHHVAAALAGVPCAADVAYALSEVAANAVVHSRSGQPGGHFTVAADVLPGVLAAVTVTDQGGPWAGREADTYPHGLEILRQIATEVRVDGGDDSRTVWVIFGWEAQG